MFPCGAFRMVWACGSGIRHCSIVADLESKVDLVIGALKLLHDQRKRTVHVAVIERVVSEFCSNVRIRAVLDEETNDVCVTALYCVVKWSQALVRSKQ